MIKVFLVEDEFVIREGIKKNIDWAGHGYEFCGEASDGELAFPMIKKLKPDIVITDIRMPFMDYSSITVEWDCVQKVKDDLIGSERNLRLANDKAQNLSIKSLTKNSPLMKSSLLDSEFSAKTVE